MADITVELRKEKEPRSWLLPAAKLLQRENWRHLWTRISGRMGQGEQVWKHLTGQIWQLQRTGSSLGFRSRLKVYP